jgi:hypothetical protein
MSVVIDTLHQLTTGGAHLSCDTQPTYTRIISQRSGRFNETFVFPKYAGLALANVRIMGNHWTSASLYGGELDQHGPFFTFANFGYVVPPAEETSFPVFHNGKCLPYVDKHELKLVVRGNDSPVEIQYDIVEYPTQDLEQQESFVFRCQQTTGIENVPAGLGRLYRASVSFNLPTERLSLHVVRGHLDALRPMEFVCNLYHPTEPNQPMYRLPLEKVSSTQYRLNYGEKLVNLSRLNTAYIEFERGEEELEIELIADSFCIGKIANGEYDVTGLTYQWWEDVPMTG